MIIEGLGKNQEDKVNSMKCPRCGSKRIKLDTGGQTGKCICKDCRLLGPEFLFKT